MENQKETEDPHKHFPLRDTKGEEISDKHNTTAKNDGTNKKN